MLDVATAKAACSVGEAALVVASHDERVARSADEVLRLDAGRMV